MQKCRIYQFMVTASSLIDVWDRVDLVYLVIGVRALVRYDWRWDWISWFVGIKSESAVKTELPFKTYQNWLMTYLFILFNVKFVLEINTLMKWWWNKEYQIILSFSRFSSYQRCVERIEKRVSVFVQALDEWNGTQHFVRTKLKKEIKSSILLKSCLKFWLIIKNEEEIKNVLFWTFPFLYLGVFMVYFL